MRTNKLRWMKVSWKRNLPSGWLALQAGVLAVAASVFIPSAGVAAAQERCLGGVRELSSQSARTRLIELKATDIMHRDLIGDASCGTPQRTLLTRRFRFGSSGDTMSAALLQPSVRSSFVGGVADARDDGTMWSGRGANFYGSVTGALAVNRVHALLAPSMWWAENRRYDVIATRDLNRNDFASPWYAGTHSADLPLRPGVDPILQFELGASALWTSILWFDAGIAASPQSWGPGLRAHLLLGQDAPGIPRIFLRTSQPVRTAIGTISASGFLGRLTESRFFDSDPTNDNRRLWAWMAALNPSSSEHFSMGTTGGLMQSAWLSKRPLEALLTVFARARSADDAFRAWVELGRTAGSISLRNFLTIPYLGIAYIVGLEYAQPFQRGSLSIAAELVNLEQPLDLREEPPRDFYTSEAISQGWTQRGRVLGVSTGPGSQSQWIGLDWVSRAWSAGVFGERVRWNEDALLREFLPYQNRHDVTLRMGLRGGYVTRGYEFSAQLSTGKRLNYLFQNGSFIPGFRTVDVSVPQLRFALTPLDR